MKHRSGFTLIELVAVLVLSSVVAVTVVPMLPMAQRQTYDTQTATAANQAGDSVYTYITNLLNEADRIYLGTATDRPEGSDWHSLSVDSTGLLALDNTPVYDAAYQDNCVLTLTASIQGRSNMTLGITLTQTIGENKVLYNRESVFQPAKISGVLTSSLEGNTTVAAASSTQPRVIYFTYSTAIPTPAPTLPPEQSTPVATPAPANQLLVNMPSSLSLDLSTSPTGALTPSVQLPDNSRMETLFYEWSIVNTSAPLYHEYTDTHLKVTGTSWDSQHNMTALQLQALSATQDSIIIQLTVSVSDQNNHFYQQTVQCAVTISGTTTPQKPNSDGLGIYLTNNWGAWEGTSNLVNTTYFHNIKDNALGLSAVLTSNLKEPINGTWSVSRVILPNGTETQDTSMLTGDGVSKLNNKHWGSFQINSTQEAIVEFRFDGAGHSSWENGETITRPNELRSGTITIVFYRSDDSSILDFDLHLEYPDSDQSYKHMDVTFGSVPDGVSFAKAVYSIQVIAQGDAQQVIKDKLGEAPTVTLSTYKGDYQFDLTNVDQWFCEQRGYMPYAIKKPSEQRLVFNPEKNLFEAVFPLYFINETPGGGANAQDFNICGWIWQDTDSGRNIWLHPSMTDTARYSTIRVGSASPFVYTGTVPNGNPIQQGQQVLLYYGEPIVFSAYNASNTRYVRGDWTLRILQSWDYNKTITATGEGHLDVTNRYLPAGIHDVIYKPNDWEQPEYTSYNWGNGLSFTARVVYRPILFAGEQSQVQTVNNQLVSSASPNYANGYVFVDITKPQKIQGYAHPMANVWGNPVIQGTWTLDSATAVDGTNTTSFLGQDTLSVLQSSGPAATLPLSATGEGVVTVTYTSAAIKADGGALDWNQTNTLKDGAAKLTIIFYDGSNGHENSQMVQMNTLVKADAQSDFTDSLTLKSSSAVKGEYAARARIQLTIPSRNITIRQTISDALRWAGQTISPTTGFISNLHLSNELLTATPLNGHGLTQDLDGTWYADYDLRWNNLEGDLTAVLAAGYCYQADSYKDGDSNYFHLFGYPPVGSSATIKVTVPQPLLYTSKPANSASRMANGSTLTMSKGQSVIVYAFGDPALYTLQGNWTIEPLSGGAVTKSFGDSVNLSTLERGEYTVRYKSTTAPYSGAEECFFTVKVETKPYVVAFTETVTPDPNDRKAYVNNDTVTAGFHEKLNLHAFLNNNGGWGTASGTWSVTSDPYGIIETTTINGSVATFTFHNSTVSRDFTVQFTPSDASLEPLNLVVHVIPSRLAGQTKGPTNGSYFTIQNGKGTVISGLTDEVLKGKHLRWTVNNHIIYDGSKDGTGITYTIPSSNGKTLMQFKVSDHGKTVNITGSNGTGSSRAVKLTLEYAEPGTGSWVFYDFINITTK